MIRRRPALPLGTRSVLLFSALLFASTGYAVLTATTQTSTLAVRGTIDEAARVAAYDILVRPKGARLPLEESRNLVQPGFLNAVAGCITVAQWHQIKGLRDVAVAAPIALLGYTAPAVEVPVDLPGLDRLKAPILIRSQSTWHYDNGASQLESVPTYYYLTPNPVRFEFVDSTLAANRNRRSAFVEQLPDGTTRRLDVYPTLPRWTYQSGPPQIVVVSTLGQKRRGHLVGTEVSFPFLVAAVDPASEAQLSGLAEALTSGAYFAHSDTPPVGEVRQFHFQDGQEDPRVPVPVLVASRPGVAFRSETHFSVVNTTDVTAVTRALLRSDGPTHVEAEPLGTVAIDQTKAYRSFVDGMATPQAEGSYLARSTLRYLRTSSAVIHEAADGAFAVETVAVDANAWGSPGASGDVVDGVILPGGDDTSFREVTSYVADVGAAPPALVKVGVFDADRLRGNGTVQGIPLGSFSFSAPVGADDASRKALGDAGWFPSADLAGYVQQPPLMLTTLDYLPLFADAGRWFQTAPGGLTRFGITPISDDPLSAIRVKVAGVNGVGPLDRERVRAVAEEIATLTGLEVDITLGSSPGQQTVAIPAGEHGRPAMTIAEWWVSKGVAVTLIEAGDRKSVMLGWLSLLTTVLVVANAVLASVRARRREIGTVLALGWSRRAVFAHVLTPVLITAGLAGVTGAGLALLIRAAVGLPLALSEIALAVPVAVGVALLAAIGPAWAASRLDPVIALQPPVASGAPRGHLRSLVGLPWRAVRATPGRALLAAAGVAVASSAVATIGAIHAEFNGRAVGTLLGEAVTVQVRGPDIAAATLGFALAGLGLYHLVATEIRERAMELTLLRAMGWTSTAVVSVLSIQAFIVGLVGSALGGAIACSVLLATFGTITTAMWWGIGAAVLLALPLALVVTWLADALRRRLPIGELVAAE